LDAVNRAVDLVLIAGLSDWIQGCEVQHAVDESDPEGLIDEEGRRRATVETIREMVSAGFAEVGDVTAQGFAPWQLSLDDAIREIERRWAAMDFRKLTLGDLCWLRLTENGKQLAEDVERRLFPSE
jgi:hypothetical protein